MAMCSLGTSRNYKKVALALTFMMFGHQRSTAVSAYLQQVGRTQNMGTAEVTAAVGNFLAILKVFVPLLYGNLFAWATSKGRYIPGLPYFSIAFLTVLAQLNFGSITLPGAQKPT